MTSALNDTVNLGSHEVIIHPTTKPLEHLEEAK